MIELVYKIITVIGVVLLTAIRRYFCKKFVNTTRIHPKNCNKEELFIKAAHVLWFIPIILYVTPFVLNFSMINLACIWRFVGIVLIFLAIVLFYFVHKHLGNNWLSGLGIRKNHSLVTNGLYKYVRHPMYSIYFLYFSGQFLVVSNYIAGTLPIIGFTILYLCRIRNEEAMMIDYFGNEYKKYVSRTGRLVPKLSCLLDCKIKK